MKYETINIKKHSYSGKNERVGNEMIELEVKIPDAPGALIKLIKPISENSGNIHGIVHHHDEKADNFIPVNVHFELIGDAKQKNLEKIKKLLLELKFQILSITDTPAVHLMTVILSGHVFRKDFEDTIIRITKKGAKVYDLEAKFTVPQDTSNVKFIVEIPDEVDDKLIINELEEICKEKEFFLLIEEKL